MFAVLRALNREQRSAVLASFLGWTLDAFDFFLLSFVVTDIAKEFSTDIEPVAEAFFVTLAMRPVGAFIFGLLAERFGRRPVLMFDILFYSVMALATAFSTSVWMLLVLRALFGIGMGGEWGLGASLALETVPAKARGLVSGILQQGYAVGNMLAAIVYWTIYQYIGWRGMFVVGIAPALLVLYLRLNVKESPVWEATRAERGSFVASLRESVRGRWPLFLYVVLLMTCFNSMSHATQDLFPTFLKVQHHLGPHAVGAITVVANLGAVTGGVLFGAWSERLGRRRTIVLAALLIPFAVWTYSVFSGPVLLAASAFVVQLLVQGAFAMVPVHLNELSPEGARGTFPGFTYQLGNLFSSKNQPLQAAFAARHGNNYGLAITLLAIAAALLVSLVAWFGP
ncbi:MAG TPA: MFS transporter, partial [Alphaproteobacteria bacterium]|nr:MFS transporter [Alphaproteobacteria bacterium]